MMITKKALSRRTMIRGLGVTLALPLLDGMVPAMTALAQTPAKRVNRLGVVYVPNGVIMEDWIPDNEGPLALKSSMQSLEPFKQHVLVLSGLDCEPSPGRPGGAHAKASTRFLTDVSPPMHPTWLDAGISMDQIAARELGKQTQLASLELAVEAGQMAGACDSGFACPYNNTISWSSASTPLPMQNDPRVIFERLFGDSGTTDSKLRLARIQQKRSILDSVSDELGDLQRRLGRRDRTKLSEYLEAIRNMERRIERAEQQSDQELPLFDTPAGIPTAFEDHVKLLFDLEVLAYQSDLTRIITLMIGREQTGMTYPQIGVPDAHHPVSHHQNDPVKIAKNAKINEYHVRLFSYFVDKLQATPDGDGTLLDNVTLVYGCGMADCNSHEPRNIPLMLVGGGAGHLKGGRHIRYAKGTPLANLHLTLLDQFGVPWDRIGDSNGKVDHHQLSVA
jgi:hypothetical protein